MSEATGTAAGVTPLVELESVTVDFDATRALDGVSLALYPGQIVGLVGPNGAGKSTLGKILVGEIPSGSFDGALRMGGEPAEFRSTRDAHSAGIALIHQERATINEMSIAENVMLTIQPRGRFGIDWNELHRRAREQLLSLGLDVDTYMRVADAGVAVQQLVDVARALAMGRRLFVFDESTAALGANEVRILIDRMRELRERDAAVLFISHRLSEVLAVSDRIVVMRDGRIVLDDARSAVDHRAVVRAMLGSQFREFQAHTSFARPADEGALELREWTLPSANGRKMTVGPVDVRVRRGEVLGVFGPLGAGKTELLYSLFGLFGSEPTGELLVGGRQVRLRGPKNAIANGIGLLPSDRRGEGIVPGLSVKDNMMLSSPSSVSRIGMLQHDQAELLCGTYVEQLGIKIAATWLPIDNLSGGNQQKVLLARCMATSPGIMLLDEPTRGIDVGAKVDVYRLVDNLTKEGTACVFTSMEADEILLVADRILVLRDGQPVALLDRDETTEQDLVHLATGGDLT